MERKAFKVEEDRTKNSQCLEELGGEGLQTVPTLDNKEEVDREGLQGVTLSH